jgi:acyl-CoA synthetase (AMP-forming)/AMP-acid ligase II
MEMFEYRRLYDPQAVLLLTPDGVGRTYAELAERVECLAIELYRRGVRQGDVVGLYLGNEPNWVVAVLACWRCGCTFAACGSVSPTAEAERRFAVVQPRLVLTYEGAELGSSWPVVALTSEGDVLDAGGAQPSTGDVPLDPVDLDPSDMAAIFFTSGTVGEAKATLHTHDRLVGNARATAAAYAGTANFRPRVRPAERPPSVSFSPFGHLAAVGRLIFRIYVGRSLLIVPRFDVSVLSQLAKRYPLDTLQLAPAMVHALAYTPEAIDLGSLRYVTSGTAPLPVATRNAFEERYGVPVLQAYGSTEGAVTARERYDDVRAGRRGPGSVGRVDEDCPVRIVDPKGKDVALGQDGEIIGRPDLSRTSRYFAAGGESSLPVDPEGWYHTGDVGHFDENGILYITGRIKEMFVVGGFNVFPAEIEDALRASPLVSDAVVVSVADDRLGEVPVAGIVWRETTCRSSAFERSIAQLATELREQLAPYKVPRHWLTLTAVPLNGNGKVDRKEVASIAAVNITKEPS